MSSHQLELASAEGVTNNLDQTPEDDLRVILSDFDYTLCYEYGFDPESNNHLPYIYSELIEAAQGQNLIVATGRRAKHPFLPVIWQSGLVDPRSPVIAENGGTLVFYGEQGRRYIDLVTEDDIALIHESRERIRQEITDMPKDQELIFKLGRTMLLTRLQNAAGEVDPLHNARLAERVQELFDPSHIRVVDTRASVIVQQAEVNKSAGFRRYLGILGLQRSDVHVTGLGDGLNDRELFEEADVSIGFSRVVRPYVDIEIPGSPANAARVLRTLANHPSRRLHSA